MDFLRNIFNGGNDEILFFILVFLFLFSGNLFGIGPVGGVDGFDGGTILFFIIIFLLLFSFNDFAGEVK